MEIYSDRPITNKKDDRLGRDTFAYRIANSLVNDKNTDNTVIAINGKWGSGKTSFINLIKGNIHLICNGGNTPHPMIVDFSPWSATSEEKLISQFLGALKESMSLKTYRTFIKTVKIALSTIDIVASFSPLSAPAKAIVEQIKKAFDKYSDKVEKESQDVEMAKQMVESKLKISPFKYIVFIDDIDRLNDNEIVLLTQLIKAICNFSNVTYVLSYDKEIVANALNNQQSNVNGFKYLEKIVQVEFAIPEIKHSRITNILFEDLDALLNGLLKEDDTIQITNYYSLGLFTQFENIRQVRRFINRLKFELDSFGKNINLADLIVITYLRCIDEHLIYLFMDYKEHLLGMVHYHDSNEKNEAEKEFMLKLSDTDFDNKGQQKYLLGHLFPHMFNYISDRSDEYLNGRLCCLEHFNEYLHMEVDDDDFALSEVKGILDLKNVDELINFASKLNNGDQGRRVLHLLHVISQQSKNMNQFKTMLSFLFTNISDIKFVRPFFFVEKDFFIKEICFNAIENVGQKEFENIICESVDNYNDPFALAAFLFILDEKESEKRISVSVDIKTRIIEKAKEVILAQLNEGTENIKYRPELVIRAAIDYFEDDLKKLISSKDDLWIIDFICQSMYLSWMQSDKKYLRFGYDLVRLNLVIPKEKLNIDKLIEIATSEKKKQRLIVLKMQIDGIKPKEDGMYFANEIQTYCDNIGLNFDANDRLEQQ